MCIAILSLYAYKSLFVATTTTTTSVYVFRTWIIRVHNTFTMGMLIADIYIHIIRTEHRATSRDSEYAIILIYEFLLQASTVSN